VDQLGIRRYTWTFHDLLWVGNDQGKFNVFTFTFPRLLFVTYSRFSSRWTRDYSGNNRLVKSGPVAHSFFTQSSN
jgi:hypothetical protein